jgi:hypothetical protein
VSLEPVAGVTVSGWESWWAEPGVGLGTVEGVEERRSAELDMVGALVEDGVYSTGGKRVAMLVVLCIKSVGGSDAVW